MGKTSRPRTSGTQKAKKPRYSGRPYIKIALALVALALLLRLTVIHPYRMPSRSMEDTLLAGDCLLVDKLVYGLRLPFAGLRLPGWGQPVVGDIVVFQSPAAPQRTYAKRCIAIAGQVVEIRNKVVYVDERRLPDPPYSKYVDVRILPADKAPRDNYGPQSIPAGFIFVLGDNRDNSRDSRHWGLLSTDRVVGKGRWVYWSYEPLRRGTEAGLLERLVRLPGRIRWGRLWTWIG